MNQRFLLVLIGSSLDPQPCDQFSPPERVELSEPQFRTVAVLTWAGALSENLLL
jgi:hypothetical protein